MKRTATKFTEAQLAEIAAIQQKSNTTRNVAVQRFLAAQKKAAAKTAKVEPPVADGKQLAANDAPEVVTEATPEPKTETPAATAATKLTPEQVGANRAAGMKLFAAAGRPSKADFIELFGQRGALMTWVERGRLFNMTPDQVAANFQRLLAEKRSPAPAPIVETPTMVTEETVVVPAKKSRRKRVATR
jgi:hypothetical protein